LHTDVGIDIGHPGTLYSGSNAYVEHCRARANKYLADKFGWTEEEARRVRKAALKEENQTVKGASKKKAKKKRRLSTQTHFAFPDGDG